MGGLGRKSRAELLPTNLPQLQNLMKRDPSSYTEEFLQQLRHYEASRQIFLLKPTEESKEFAELCMFLSHVAPLYKKHCAHLPGQLMELLQQQHQVLHPTTRKTLVQSLILLRNREMVATVQVLELFFTLFRCPDKTLRQLLHSHIVSDIKNSNANHKNNQLNKTLQNFMFGMVNDQSELAAKKSLDVMIELYRKRVWDDAKTVNVIAQACLSNVTKVMATALQFFLGGDTAIEEEEDNDDMPNIRDMQTALRVSKKTKKKEQRIEHAIKTIKRRENQRKNKDQGSFSALHLINDPQGFAEKLFNKLKQSNDKFEVRLQLLKVISRLVGVHQLILLNLYSFLQKYIQPHQREVTQILAIAAQASHPLVPPDALEPIVQAIANNFVSDHCAPEVMSVGLNAIREVAARCPAALTTTLLRDLAMYKNNRDKGVMIGARALIGLYRELDPTMLHKKDRGKIAAENLDDFKVPQYGQAYAEDHVPGVEYLQAINELEQAGESSKDAQVGNIKANEDDDDEEEEDGNGWETASDDEDDDDDDNWITVQHSSDEEDTESNPKDDPTTAALLKASQVKRKPEELMEAQRILTPQDFVAMKKLKQQAELAKLSLTKGQKRKLQDRKEQDHENDDKEQDAAGLSFTRHPDEIVEPELLLRNSKRRKQTYEERLASIQTGREGREKFGSNKGLKQRGSLTNKEKSKKKNFGMMRYKEEVRQKQFRSLRDKQIAARQAIVKEKKKIK